MLGLARLGTADVARAKQFYGAIAEILGGSMVVDRKGVVGFRSAEGGILLIGKPIEGLPTAGNGSQVGLVAPSPTAVDAAYACAMRLGATSIGEPGPRGAPDKRLYAAYFRDPDGNKVMVLHTAVRRAAASYHPPVKRSVEIAGHKTSVSLEPLFWDRLRAAAAADAIPVNALVARIDAERLEAEVPPGLASAIRLWLASRFTES